MDLEQYPEQLDVAIWTGWDDPVLSKVCEPFSDSEFGSKLEAFGTNMVNTMKRSRGIGLAGSQVSILKAIFVMQPEWKRDILDEPKPLIVCNPVLVLDGREADGTEGCLSLPGIYEEVTRTEKVTMQYREPSGKMCEVILNNLDARVAQHEADHLNGIMFFDRRRMGRQSSRRVQQQWDKVSHKYL
jgi:peptide deformylase